MLIYYSDIGKRELHPMDHPQFRESLTAAAKALSARITRLTLVHLIAAAVVTALGLGCDSKQGAPRGTLPSPGSRIVVIGPPAGDPAWPAIRGGARRGGRETPNVVVETAVPEDATDTAYRRLIEQVLSKPAVAVCLYVPPSAEGQNDADPDAEARPAGGEGSERAADDAVEPRPSNDDGNARPANDDGNARPASAGAADSAATRTAAASQPAAADPFVALARDIQRRGALLITMGRDLAPGVAFGHVAVDWPAGAELLGRRLKAIAPDKSSYVLLHQRGISPLGSACYDRFNLTATRELMTRLTERAAGGAAGRQREQIRDMLGEFPAAGLVVTLAPDVWLADGAPRLPPQNAIATLSAVPPLWSKLASGEAAALVGPLDGQIGAAAVELAWQGLTGSERAGVRRLVPCELATPETRIEFERRYAEAAGVSSAELKSAGG